MSCKECGVQSEVAHRLSCPTLKQPAPTPPTLAEACEVIEALLEDASACDGHARDFLERVKGRHG